MKDNEIPDNIVPLIKAILDDSNLQSLFLNLDKMPENMRISILGQMKEKMKSNNEDPHLIALVDELNKAEIFSAVVKTIKDMTAKKT
jgi:hypothetical protein